MGAFSIWHWIIVLAVVVLLFGGRGKISAIMGDFDKGLNAFKKNVKDQDKSTEASGDSTDSKRIATEDGDSVESSEKDKAASS